MDEITELEKELKDARFSKRLLLKKIEEYDTIILGLKIQIEKKRELNRRAELAKRDPK